ncbi:transcriptional regulator family: Fungal Specific TF [Paecilomyces variotii]|nr:transcriptional regulator family: Fungal Specific TF [Paecilomyces variotii]
MLNWDAIAASEGFPDSSLDRYGDFTPKTSAGEDAMEDVLSPQVYHEEDPTTEDKPSNGIHSVDIGGAPDLSPASSINQNSSPQGVGSETYQREDHASTNHSLDEMQDFTAKLFGISAESDPWLLRHCRFDEHGLRRFYKVHFRNVADISEPEQVPIHFMIASNDLVEGFKSDTAPSSSENDLRTELENLIPTEDGRRLFKLFLTHVFPLFPVVSRSQLRVMAPSLLPDVSELQKIPTHLLAAVYASAIPFVPYDSYLCVSNVYRKPPADQIWRIAYRDIQIHMHDPRLSVLQAALLYQHKPRSGSTSAVADTPFHSSFMGSVVGLATSLGLHLDCQAWRIPWWEKRLRRRLWWITFSEDKWRSLSSGRPSFINRDDWQVSELTDDDFEMDTVPSNLDTILNVSSNEVQQALPFRLICSLAQIAEDVYKAFYTVRTIGELSTNIRGSLETVRPVRGQLSRWYASLPESLRLRKIFESEPSIEEVGLTAPVHFAYLTLELYLYRAVLRPLARSGPTGPQCVALDNSATQDDFAIDPDIRAGAEAVIDAAERCAEVVIEFVTNLNSSDFCGFWYSWSRVGFAVMSNFVVLLLIQAPTEARAAKARRLVDRWRKVLRLQSRYHEQMNLGMLRLDAMHWIGLDETFKLSSRVDNAIHANLVE